MTVGTRIQHRGSTAAVWTSANPVLLEREIGYETDTGKSKMGDGTSAWNSLPYQNATSATQAGRPTVRLGVFPDTFNTNSQAQFVAAAGEPVTVKLVPYNFLDSPNVAALQALNASGITPMISWQPTGATEGTSLPAYSLSAIISGTYDTYITSFFTTLAGLGFPVMVKWGAEMNGDWNSWSEGQNGNTTGQFVLAWRRVYGLGAAAGATNVIRVWSPTTNFTSSVKPLSGLYPGNDWVDIVALHGYNWGSAGPGGWLNPAELFNPTVADIQLFARGKPLWLGEIGCDPTGGDKAAWFGLFFQWVLDNGVGGFVYFNSDTPNVTGGNWRVDSSTPAAAGFTAGMQKLRKLTQPTGLAVASPDRRNVWTDRQDFSHAEVVGLPSSTPPTLEQLGAAPATITNNWFSDNFTLALWQAGRQASYDSTSAGTLTVPTNATVAFPIGTGIRVYQNNIGSLTVAGASGVTVQAYAGSRTLSGPGAMGFLYKVDTNFWQFWGNATSIPTINAKTASYTAVSTDQNAFVTLSSASAMTFTVPPNSAVPFLVGTILTGAQLGAGQVTLTPGVGVTINGTPGLKVAAQYGSFALIKVATDTWLATGALAA